MGYWQDIFETYKAVHTDEPTQVDGAEQNSQQNKAKQPYVIVQIAFPLEDESQIKELNSLEKLFEHLLKASNPTDVEVDEED